MPRSRRIYLLSDSEEKRSEIESSLSKYGVECCLALPDATTATPSSLSPSHSNTTTGLDNREETRGEESNGEVNDEKGGSVACSSSGGAVMTSGGSAEASGGDGNANLGDSLAEAPSRTPDTPHKRILGLLRETTECYWTKAVFREDTLLVTREDWERFEGDDNALVRRNIWNSSVGGHDCEPCVAISRLTVWYLPMDSQARLRQGTEHAASLRHPGQDSSGLVDAVGLESSRTEGSETLSDVYVSHLEGFIDMSRRRRQSKRKPRRILARERKNGPDTKRLNKYMDAEGNSIFGWDDVFVVKSTGLTFQEMKRLLGKVSPRDQNVNKYVLKHLHYAVPRKTNFLRCEGDFNVAIMQDNPDTEETISFRPERSVGAFVGTNEFLNNEVCRTSGLYGAFVSVANSGAFFRAARTRRCVNYWLPGLNAGIPFVPKADPVHEITFMAHDMGHFLIPDLIYTGNNDSPHKGEHYSSNYRKTYILYRMMSEATTLVFADMLFVESLRLSGYEYDWKRRQIHPLLQALGMSVFGKDIDTKNPNSQAPLSTSFQKLLHANVEYCLLGSDSGWRNLSKSSITKKGGINSQTQASEEFEMALKNFKDKYMPFFVEDYRWTSANYDNMAQTPEIYKKWWTKVEPIVLAAGLNVEAPSSGTIHDSSSSLAGCIGLETVEQFMAAINVGGLEIDSRELIDRILDRVWKTRLQPVFVPHAPHQPTDITAAKAHDTQQPQLRNAFMRYMVGQFFVFAKFDFLSITKVYEDKLRNFLLEHLPDTVRNKGSAKGMPQRTKKLSLKKVKHARDLYRSYLNLLEEMSLLTKDDVANYADICPLFDPVYVHYDEKREFYDELVDVQQKILEGDKVDICTSDRGIQSHGAAGADVNIITMLPEGLRAIDSEQLWKSVNGVPVEDKLQQLLKNCGVPFWTEGEIRTQLGRRGWSPRGKNDTNLVAFVKRQPVVAISAIGGVPIRIRPPERQSDKPLVELALGMDQRYPLTIASIRQAFKAQMAYASFPTYLNPNDLTAEAMFDTVIKKHGHFSVGHTCFVSFVMAGFSCAVEQEFNSQRDVVHMARLTVARTKAQSNPPIIVPSREMLRIYLKVRREIAEETRKFYKDVDTVENGDSMSKPELYEALNTVWPCAKAHIAVISGSIRNFQKLVKDIDNSGKETEYKMCLWELNKNLNKILPEMFGDEESWKWRPPT